MTALDDPINYPDMKNPLLADAGNVLHNFGNYMKLQKVSLIHLGSKYVYQTRTMSSTKIN